MKAILICILVQLSISVVYIIHSYNLKKELIQVKAENVQLEAKYEYEKAEHTLCLTTKKGD